MKHLADMKKFGHGICGAKGDTTNGGTSPGAPQGVTCPQCLGLYTKSVRRATAYDD